MVQGAERLFATRTTRDWIDHLRRAGVPCGPFNFLPEVFEDPQVRANDYLARLEHPELGTYETFAPPIRMAGSPVEPRGPSPALDAHTDAVLGEAGFAPDEIAQLRARGIVGAHRKDGRS